MLRSELHPELNSLLIWRILLILFMRSDPLWITFSISLSFFANSLLDHPWAIKVCCMFTFFFWASCRFSRSTSTSWRIRSFVWATWFSSLSELNNQLSSSSFIISYSALMLISRVLWTDASVFLRLLICSLIRFPWRSLSILLMLLGISLTTYIFKLQSSYFFK